MNISELNWLGKNHLAWRLDNKTHVGILTAIQIVKGYNRDLDLVEVFLQAGCTPHSAKIQARKVINYNDNRRN